MGLIDLRIDLKMNIERGERWRTRHERLRQLHHGNPNTNPNSSVGAAGAGGSSGGSTTNRNNNNDKKKPMDLELYEATIRGDVDNFIETLVRVSIEKELSLAAVFDQSSPLQNSYLHVAASFGHNDLVPFISYHFPSLLSTPNARGDTPLHIAARAGHIRTAKYLIRFGIDTPSCSSTCVDGVVGDPFDDIPDILLRSTNDEGNTALHEAILNNHEDMVGYLSGLDAVVPYYPNKEGKSPFYLAVESGKKENIQHMLWIFNREQCSYEDMTKGKSLIHAAIRARNKGLLRTLLNKMPTLIQLKDEEGETPLQCATSIGYFEGVQYLLDKFPEYVLERDDDGLLPVHTASRKGHVDILQKLLRYCPDWRELLTNKGENILHVAAKSGKINVIDHVLKTLNQHEKLVNEKDSNGNTPLHLAAMHWHPKVVSYLTWDKRVNLKLVNDDGMTALDVAEERMEMMPSFRKRLTWTALKSAGAPGSKCSKVPKASAHSSLKQQPNDMDNYKDRINTLLLVSTLVATVTYAAGFTMPGGYNNSDPNQGIATMLNQSKFQIFVICDTIAMYSAIIVAVSLIWAQLGDLNLVLNSLRLALPLLGIALSMMSLAFMAGVYLVVSKLNWLSHVVLIMGIVFLVILLTLFIPLSFSLTSNCRVLRYISYYCLCLMMLASGSYHDDEEE